MADGSIRNAVLIAAIICALFIAVFYRRGSRLLNPRLALAAFLALFFLAGILRFNTVDSKTHNLQKFAEAQENVVDPQNRHPIKVTIYGYVTDEPQVSGDKQRLVVYAKQLRAGQYLIDLQDKVLITTGLYPQYRYGEQLKIYGQTRRPENFNDFDYIGYLAKGGIFTTIFYPEIEPTSFEFSFVERIKTSFLGKIFAIKGAFEKSIARSVSEPNAAFIDGILLGSRSQVPQDLKDSFVRTGTSHILAISGYNITMVIMIFSWIFLFFMRRSTAFWFSLIGVTIFTILTGAQASVVRAAIMGVIVLLAHREGRLNDPRNAIVFAGGAMILINPLILRHDIGFQLSFMATLGLIYLAPAIERHFEKVPKWFGLREIIIMTVSAQIFVLPLLLYHFKALSLIALPANLIILPTIPIAMLLGFITGLSGLVLPFLGQLLGYFAWLLTFVELFIIRLFSRFSWAVVPIGINWYTLAGLYVILVWSTLKLKKDNGLTG